VRDCIVDGTGSRSLQTADKATKRADPDAYRDPLSIRAQARSGSPP
jgi:hypothetical protein